jgi:hypothetical protein
MLAFWVVLRDMDNIIIGTLLYLPVEW